MRLIFRQVHADVARDVEDDLGEPIAGRLHRVTDLLNSLGMLFQCVGSLNDWLRDKTARLQHDGGYRFQILRCKCEYCLCVVLWCYHKIVPLDWVASRRMALPVHDVVFRPVGCGARPASSFADYSPNRVDCDGPPNSGLSVIGCRPASSLRVDF